MSSTLSAPSIDDLVDMFPQYPRSTVVDVLQRVGAAQAVETLLTFADEVSVNKPAAVVASIDQFTSEMFRKEKTSASGGISGANGPAVDVAPRVSGASGVSELRHNGRKALLDSVEGSWAGSTYDSQLTNGHLVAGLAPPELADDHTGVGLKLVVPEQVAAGSLHHAIPSASVTDAIGHQASPAVESLPPTAPSENVVLAPSSHDEDVAAHGPSAAMLPSPHPDSEGQALIKEVPGLAEAPDPELWADDHHTPAGPPPSVGPPHPCRGLSIDAADAQQSSAIVDPAAAATGEAAFLQGMFPDIDPDDVALALSDAGDRIESAVERLMELNEAGAERLRTPSSSDSGVDAEELPLDQKLMLLGLQFPDLAPTDVRTALDGEGGSLEAATVLLEFYDEEDKAKKAAADKAVAEEASDRDLALKLQQQEEVAPPTPTAWHVPTADAMDAGSPLVVRTPGGSAKVDDSRFAAKVAHLSRSFPDAGEEEVAAALLHADYHPNDAKQVLRTRGFKEVQPASLRVAAPRALAPTMVSMTASTRSSASHRPPLVANGNVQGLSHLAKRQLQYQQNQALYKEKRARAQALYSQRDQRQAQAGHAWSSGDRALAQRLSEEAVALSAEARAANDLAGKQIHSQKNSVCEIDLHGLHTHEALGVVEQTLAERDRLFSFMTTIKFITGRGSHSEGGVSKLVPAVRKWLEDRRIPYKIAMDSGSFFVPRNF